MPKVDKAAIGAAGVMGGGALVVSVLGAKTPPTGLPERAFFYRMSRLISAASEAIWELGFGLMMPLAHDSTMLQIVFSWLYIRWSLSCKDAQDALAARGKEGSHGRGRRAGNEEVLLEAGMDGTGRKVLFYCK